MMRKFWNWPGKKQKTAASPLASTVTNTEGSVLPQEASQFKGSSPLTCKELFLSYFIDAYCNDNLAAVYQFMDEPLEKKPFRWLVILEEWSWLMKNEDGDNLFSIANKILQLKTQITFVDYAVFFLDQRYDKDIADKLRSIYPADYTDKKNLKRALTLVDTKRYELDILTDEYNRLQDSNKGEKLTEPQFISNVARLSKHQGYRIDIQKTTVAEYAAIHQNFLTEIKTAK